MTENAEMPLFLERVNIAPFFLEGRMMNNKWFDAIKDNKLIEGNFSASIKVKCLPNTRISLPPVITIKGEIEEWHLLISDPPQMDWRAISNGPKPTPGSPIITATTIRFHPDDVKASIDVQEELHDLKNKYEELRFQRE